MSGAGSPTRVPAAPPRLPATVVWLGVVSLCTDASGELIYPLLPLFLVSVLGAPLPMVGLIEGVAEATSSLFKLISGRISDRMARKKPLVLLGYALASFARPLVALARSPWTVLAVRFADRLGKGVRSSPRDALLADVTHPSLRGAAYGYHRAMDNAGAVLGPLAGFALLRLAHLDLRAIFALAAVPGGLAVLALLVGVKEEPRRERADGEPPGRQPVDAALQQGVTARRDLALYFGCVAIFTLGNSTDAFLLVRAAQVLHPGQPLGAVMLADPEILLLWTAHNAVKALLSTRGGALSDRYGRRLLIGTGWLLYAATYLWFAVATHEWEMWALFPVYGVYYALVEGPERALVAELAGEARRGTAFGWFHGIVGLTSLPASLLFGLLYQESGPLAAFGTSAGLAAIAVVLLAFVHTRMPLARR